MDRETESWINTAKVDLDVAKHLNEKYYPKPLEIICYHAQQSAEKAIKALIIFYGDENGILKKHNLSFLLMQIKNKVSIPEKFYDYADVLTPYAISARYPNELGIEEHHVNTAIKYAEEIYQWAVEEIGKFNKNEDDMSR